MADSPVLYVYYRPDNDDVYPGVPNRHITEADWASFTIAQRRTVENATTQEGYTRRKVWVHRDLVDETEQERAQREAAEAAARAEYDRKNSLVRYGQIEAMIEQLEVLPPAEEFAALRQDVDAVADVPPRVEAVETQVARVDPGSAAPANDNRFLASIKGILNWKKPDYITVEDYKNGSGQVDVAAALAAVPATGGDVVFKGDEGTNYLIPATGINPKNKTRVTTSGSRPAVLKAPATATGAALLSIGTDVTIENIDLDLQSHATMTRGVYLNANLATYRNLVLRDVTVRNAAESGFYFWRAQGIELESVQALDCVIGIQMVQIGGQVVIDKPRIINTVAGRMKYGIRTSSGSSHEGIGLEIAHPYISGADFASANGAEAHGISIYRTRGAKIFGGTVTACGNPANKQGGGVVFTADSHLGQIEGTHIHDCSANGVWLEIVPGGETTIGSDTIKRGVSARGVRSERNSAGFAVSYGAGSHLVDCWALENKREGFYTDSENVLFDGCKAINNWADPAQPAPLQNAGAKAGFRAYSTGSFRNTYAGAFIGCDSFDNRTTKLQEYGFAAEDRGYRFVGDAGNGSIAAYVGGTTNNKFAANSWD